MHAVQKYCVILFYFSLSLLIPTFMMLACLIYVVFFAFVQLKLVKDMVHEDVVMFQNIWEETNEEQGQASLLIIIIYLKHCEDIDMGWVNVHWGVPRDLNVITSFPSK
jgi:hypothetical protein